ncbi:hypothetical protein [Dyadobacter sp. CY312]|uniref:hypothetical protein n=1 Tax=Dyadobacter sp. CY312 TaxID=2907303 RepID=UPI001F3C08B4|nr:hypothetical protein [Dyadobacter sp. CY312]MCE7044695.1 hypothetical protein [Dyadobacter sp. CY312]
MAKPDPKNSNVLAEPVMHHLSGYFRWLNIPADSYPAEGMDYFELDEQHRITRIVGFF